MDKHKKDTILTIRDDRVKGATSQCLQKKEYKIDHSNNGMEKKMPTSATKELGRHPSKKVITELLENQQRKHKLVVGLWKTSQN